MTFLHVLIRVTRINTWRKDTCPTGILHVLIRTELREHLLVLVAAELPAQVFLFTLVLLFFGKMDPIVYHHLVAGAALHHVRELDFIPFLVRPVKIKKCGQVVQEYGVSGGVVEGPPSVVEGPPSVAGLIASVMEGPPSVGVRYIVNIKTTIPHSQRLSSVFSYASLCLQTRVEHDDILVG